MARVLDNGYGLMVNENGRHTVKAVFRGKVEIVFEGISHAECVQYCHEHGMRAIDWRRWWNITNPWFVKKNAKHPFNPDEWRVGVVG